MLKSFSQTNQDLTASPGPNLPGQVVILEKTIFSTANIDVTQAAVNGKIIINLSVWYDVATGICGFLNTIGHLYHAGHYHCLKMVFMYQDQRLLIRTISPEQKSNEIVADVFVHFDKGDVLELANTSSAMVNMAAPVLGTNFPASSAYMKIILLKAD